MKQAVALVAFLVAMLMMGTTHAATISGTIKYTRNITGTSCNNATRLKCSDNGQNFGLAGVQYTATRASPPAVVVGGQTDAQGNYSITVPSAGSWLIGWKYRDGTIGDCLVGNRGTAKTAIVTFAVGGACTEVGDSGTAVNVPGSSSTVSHNVVVGTSHAGSGRANQWAIANLALNVWVGEYAVPKIIGKWKLRMQHVSSGASCGASCNAGGQDCIYGCNINMNNTSSVLFHEVGHGVMQQVQQNALARQIHGAQTFLSCNTQNNTTNQVRNFEESFADWFWDMTVWSPTTIPQFIHGNDCTSSSGHGPLTQVPVPGAPACGAGSVATGQSNLLRGFIDLTDANSVPNPPACRVENVQVPIATLIDALTKFNGVGTVGTCLGTNETGMGEGCVYYPGGVATAVPSTPAWPYTGASAGLPSVDQSGFLDYLGILKQHYGVSGSALFDIWANTSWARGDSAVQLP